MHTARLDSNARPPAARHGLSFDLIGILCAKAVLLGLLYFAFFSPAHDVQTSPSAVSAHVYGKMLK